MGISLYGLTPATTYDALIKTGDNEPLTASLKVLSDGVGTNLPMEASTTSINFTGSLLQGGVAVPTAAQVAAKQDTLVSGTNIKTINGTSVLGSGNIVTPSTNPSGVSGAIQFSNGSAFASDATNFFWDNTNKRLGVGTNTPTSPFTLIGSSQFGNAVGSGSIEIFDGYYSMSLGKSTSIYNPNTNATRIFMNASQTFVDNTSGNFQFRSAGTTVMNLQSGNFAVGNGSDSILARTHIKGSGSTSATTSLLVQNSAGSILLRATDDGIVAVGTGATLRLIGGPNPRIRGYNDISIEDDSDVHLKGIFGGNTRLPKAVIVGANTTQIASAQLQVDSTIAGFLPPRMTTTQKNAITAVAGLVVYDSTTNKLQCYNGSTWNDLF